MKNYLAISDIDDINSWIEEAIKIKARPLSDKKLGKDKILGMMFFNSSFRTRLSTQRAALNLGMNPIVMNIADDTWGIEFRNEVVMNSDKPEHVKEAASVVSKYFDIIAVRSFSNSANSTENEPDLVLKSFLKYATVPVINMESTTGHPLQGLADAITIAENSKKNKKIKVALSWVPHVKPLPCAVANSFVEVMQKMDVELVITNPKEYNLSPKITKNTTIYHNQEEAFKDIDFVYAKSWGFAQENVKSSNTYADWMITKNKIGKAKFMHCLPVRRNLVVEDLVLDSDSSIVIEQANNRTYATQLVLKKILENV